MYKRLYTFLDNSNITYNLHFGLKQEYFTSHVLSVLSNITENIGNARVMEI